jgi:hypothetical protein
MKRDHLEDKYVDKIILKPILKHRDYTLASLLSSLVDVFLVIQHDRNYHHIVESLIS